MSLLSLTKHFELIEDHRQATKVTYPLCDVLFLTVVAVIGGAEGWEDIEDFGLCHLELLKKYADFSNRIPVHVKWSTKFGHGFRIFPKSSL